MQKSIFYKHEIDGIDILAVFLDMSTLKWLIWKKIFFSVDQVLAGSDQCRYLLFVCIFFIYT